MAVIKPSINDIYVSKMYQLIGKIISNGCIRQSHHVFKETWTRFAGEKLDKAM